MYLQIFICTFVKNICTFSGSNLRGPQYPFVNKKQKKHLLQVLSLVRVVFLVRPTVVDGSVGVMQVV